LALCLLFACSSSAQRDAVALDPVTCTSYEPESYRWPLDPDAARASAAEATRPKVLPLLPAEIRFPALPDRDAIQRDGISAFDAMPRNAALMSYTSWNGGRLSNDSRAVFLMPTPRGHPYPVAGVLKHSKPWRHNGRLVHAATQGESGAELLARAQSDADRGGLGYEGYLLTVPVLRYAEDFSVVLCVYRWGEQRAESWLAVTSVDLVAGLREDSHPHDFAVPVQLSDADPRTPLGMSLERIPSTYELDGRVYPSEVLGLRQPEAKDGGVTVVLRVDDNPPGLPIYRVTSDISVLKDPRFRDRVADVLVTVTDDGPSIREPLFQMLARSEPVDR
jgi:hypothetical protein